MRDGKGNLPSEDAVLDFSNPKTVDVVSGEAGGAAEAGRRRDQGGLRRSRAVQRRLRLGPHAASTSTTSIRCATTRRSPMSPAQVNGENMIWARSAWAGQPALSRCTGAATPRPPTSAWRRRCAADSRSGSPASRSGATTSAASWATHARGSLSPLAAVRHADARTAAATACRRGSRGSTARSSPNAIPSRGRDALPADAVHLRAGEGLVAPAGCRCCARCSSSSPRTPARGWSRTNTCSAATSWSRRCCETGTTGRDVYLPPGNWIDYQTGRVYGGGLARD